MTYRHANREGNATGGNLLLKPSEQLWGYITARQVPHAEKKQRARHEMWTQGSLSSAQTLNHRTTAPSWWEGNENALLVSFIVIFVLLCIQATLLNPTNCWNKFESFVTQSPHDTKGKTWASMNLSNPSRHDGDKRSTLVNQSTQTAPRQPLLETL